MKIAAALGFFAFLLWIIVAADGGGPNAILAFVRTVPYGDKMGHAFLFGTLAFLTDAALGRRRVRIAGHKLLLGSLLVLGFAWAEELTQAFFPTRSLDITDALADLVGVGLAAWISARSSR
jgi:VanZ family protein